jgi:uncharacterized damage-inducible protein DinB
MIGHVRRILTGQFEAALCMMNDCLTKCPPEHWDGIVGKYPFWHVAYHTLCFTDLYLSRDKESFEFRDVHPCGWKEFDAEYPSRRFEQDELIAYLQICRSKAVETLANETPESLEGPSGFSWLSISRGELHLYNIRHVQHHTGQLSAYLRKVDETFQDPKAIRWVSTGWK